MELQHAEANALWVAKLLALTKMSVHTCSLEAEANEECCVMNKGTKNGNKIEENIGIV